MSGPSTLPHDKLAFCGCPLPRFQFGQCLYNSHELWNLDGTDEKSFFLQSMTFKCTSNEKCGSYVFHTCIRLYWIDPGWEPLSLRYFSHGAMGTACPSEVMWVSQWGWDNALANTALCSLTFRCSIPIMCHCVLYNATQWKYGQFTACRRKL